MVNIRGDRHRNRSPRQSQLTMDRRSALVTSIVYVKIERPTGRCYYANKQQSHSI